MRRYKYLTPIKSRSFIQPILVCLLILTGLCTLQAQSKKDSTRSAARLLTGSCTIDGPLNVISGNGATYYINCEDGTMATSWQVSCGTLIDYGSDFVTIQWDVAGCSVGTVRAKLNSATLATISVSIFPPITMGAITGGSSPINYNSSPGQMTRGTATGGSCGLSYGYQWQYSTDGITFNDISGETGTTYTPGNLTTTTYYRIKITCGSDQGYSPVRTISVYPALNPGAVTPATQATINYNSNASQLSLGSVSGGSGSYSYQWQQASNSSFSDVSNIGSATGTTYTPVTLTSAFYYRVAVTSNGVTAYSNYAFVNVYPQLVGGTIHPASSTIGYNSSPGTLSSIGVSGGSGSYTYQWQSAADAGFTSPVTIGGATNATFNPGNLTTTTYYRVIVSSNGVQVYSGTSIVTVLLPLQGGTINGSLQVIYGQSPGILNNTQAATNGNCTIYAYQWQMSLNGSLFEDIGGATFSSYTAPALVQKTWFRRKVTCGAETSYSNILAIDIRPLLVPGLVTPAGYKLPFGSSPGLISANPANGGACSGSYTYQWQQSTDDITYSNISGATALGYSVPNLTANTFYRLKVTCGADTAVSNVCTITIGTITAENLNYVRVRDITKPGIVDTAAARSLTGVNDVKQTTQYFDGLGSLMQTVARQASPQQKDVVSITMYDEFGKESTKYLPYTSNSNTGDYKTNPLAEQFTFNNTQFPGEQFYYSHTDLEASPLSRVMSAAAPGLNFTGSNRAINNDYLFNTSYDSVRIWNIAVAIYSAPSSPGVYEAGQLYKNISSDEHGNRVIEYKDKQNQVILKKVQLWNNPAPGHSGWLCTYYVYDDFNQLRLVIQPKGVEEIKSTWTITSAITNGLCFQYEYDDRGRMVSKKVPDGGESWMIYDARDRVVLSQTAQMRFRKQWMYTQYDELNRPLTTGLFTDSTNYNDRAYHQDLAYNSTSYPDLNNYTENELTRNFYDDYSWRSSYGNPLSASYINAYDTYFQTASNTVWPYPQANVQSGLTTGMLTGSRAKILGGSTTYLYTINIYDEKGRVIQVQATNIAGGEDYTTTQYTWSGQPLVVVQRQRKPGTNTQTHIIATTMTYDELGRLLTTKKTVNSTINGQTISKPEQIIASNEYDALGQLKKKTLSPTGGAGGGPVETLVYDYNIRGWMLGSNRSYAKDTNSTASHFGFELAYDKNALSVNGVSDPYAGTQFNGNIAGMLWKSGGDNRVRRYDFAYDAVNRLTNADFKQFTGSSFNLNAGLDFSATGLTYDANGNILTMKHRGWTGAKSETIDSLVYNYPDYSNQLRNVIDHLNNPQTKLGDFRASALYMSSLPSGKTATTNDYVYDNNGSLVRDMNKDIGDATNNGITNNHLSLPSKIEIYSAAGIVKGSVNYTYDALGNKLQKIVLETGKPNKTTLYLGGNVYENDTLQFIGHEEGRLRYTKRRFVNGDSAYQFQYDYFLKDHLGNVRMVLTEQTDTAKYIATMEAIYRTKENQLFYNIPQTSYSKALVPEGYPTDNTTNPNDSLARTNGSNNKVGPALILKVMSGDKVDIAVKSFYKSGGTAGNNNSPITDMLTSLATGIIGVSGESKGTLSALSNGTNSPLLGALNSFRDAQNPSQPSKPKAYLNWILLDEQFRYVAASSGADVVKDANNIYALTSSGPVNIAKNGYLYIYVSNETQNWDVFFDNLSVQHVTGPITEETHYYPFGLTMAGISSKALKPGYVENDEKYNGIDFEGDMGLEIYDAQLRELDPQVGRWWQVDPKVENMEMWSPYASNYDNPIRYSDPLGDEGQACCKELWKDIKDAAVETYKAAGDAAREINKYNPLTPVVEFITGKSQESDFSENKPRMESAGPALVTVMMFAEKPLTTLVEKAVVSTERKVVVNAAGEEGQAAARTAGTATETTAATTSTTGKANTLVPGAFAGRSIPARSKAQTFTQVERNQVNEIGYETGCHTCGVKTPGTKSGNFVPDHQPVSALVPDGTSQSLFPQCLGCSKSQGGTVGVILKKTN